MVRKRDGERSYGKPLLFLLVIFGWLWAFCAGAEAAPLENVPTPLVQPNGTAFTAYSSGDESFNYLHDAQGSLIVQDETGWYVYAANEDGQPVPSQERVASSHTFRRFASRKSSARMTAGEVDLSAYPEPERSQQRISAGRTGSKEKMYNLVVFLRFQGEEEFLSGPTEQPVTDSGMEFAESYEKARQYFDKISDGTYEPEALFLTANPQRKAARSYEDSHARGYYQPYSAANPEGYSTTDGDLERVQREMELLENALQAVLPSLPSDALLDGDEDGRIDNVTFIVSGSSGGWNQILWPHSWDLQRNKIMAEDKNGEEKQAFHYNLLLASPAYGGVGVLCHEMLHAVGFPDLYRGSDSGVPVGSWDVMATNDKEDPQFPGAYLAYTYGGWGRLEYAAADGVYTLKPLGTDDGSPDGYLIPTGDPNEFIAAEYRKSGTAGDVTQDNVPRDGLLLYRVNKATRAGNINGSAKGGDEVYVFRPGDAAVNAGTSAGLSKASLSQRWSYTSLGSASASAPAESVLYLSDGTNSRILISEVTEQEDGAVSFRVTFPEDENLVKPGTYDLSQQDYTLSDPGEYRFTGTTDRHSITVAAGAEDVTVILDSVEADLSACEYKSPVKVEYGTKAKIILEGENALTGGRYESAVHIADGAELTLTGSGALEAHGGMGAAAIGGDPFQPAGSLIVSGGSITAYGGSGYELEGVSATLAGGAAPAIGGGTGRTSGEIRLENARLALFGGEDGGERGAALSSCALEPDGYRPGGNITAKGCEIQAQGAIWAGTSLAFEDCGLTVEQKGDGTSGCLEAEGSICLKNCETVLLGGAQGSAVGSRTEGLSVTVEGGSLRACSGGYTVCGEEICLDPGARLFLSSGMTETLFSGYASEQTKTPLPVQPGPSAGAAGRSTLVQGSLEQALGADWDLRLYQNGRRGESLSLPCGCRTFAITVAGAGEYAFETPVGERSQAVSAAGGSMTRASCLKFTKMEPDLTELDLSAGPAVITESGEYLLSGTGAAVTINEGLQVALHLRGARLTAPEGQAAVSMGAGGSLILLTEESGGESCLSGGTGKPAIETAGALCFQGSGRLLALGGGTAPAVSAPSASVERECRLLLGSCGEKPVSLPQDNDWSAGYGEAPVLLTGIFHRPFAALTETTFRGIGDLEVWQLPKGFRSFCKTLSGYGEVALTTGLMEKSPALACLENTNTYEDIVMTRWNNATQRIDLSAGDAVIAEDGTYELFGTTDQHTVTVADGVTAFLRLDGLKITLRDGVLPAGRKGIIELGKNASVVLSSTAEGSSLRNWDITSGCAVVYVPASSRLAVDMTGKLTAMPGGLAPLFGASAEEDAGEIVLRQGTVECTVQQFSQSEILVGGKNGTVSLEKCTLAVSGYNSGAIGGPGAKVSISGGRLTVEGGLASGTLGGENSQVFISGGQAFLKIGTGETGVGGRNAFVDVSGGSVTVSDVEDDLGGMQTGVGGPRSFLRLTGGTVQIDILGSSAQEKGALGGEEAGLFIGDQASVSVRMAQSRNNPLVEGTLLDPAMTGGFLDARLSSAFQSSSQVGFSSLSDEGGGSGPFCTLTLPSGYYGFFVYLPAGVFEISGPNKTSAGAAEIVDRQVTSLGKIAFDRLSGVWFSNKTVEYDGTPQGMELSGVLPSNAQVTYEGDQNVLPGEYPVTATITHPGGTYALTATLTITKAPLRVTGAQAQNKPEYDGSCETRGTVLASGAKGEDEPTVMASFCFETPDVGTDKPVQVNDLCLSPEWADRYELTVPEGALDHVTASVEAPAPVEMAFREEDLLQAAGRAVPVSAIAVPAEAGIQVTYNGSPELPQEAGSYRVEAVSTDPNYTGSAEAELILAEPLDLSDGDVEITAAGKYIVTGSSEDHRILIRGEGMDGDVTLALQDVSASLSGEGAIPLEVTGTPAGSHTLTLLLPKGTGSVLRGGPGAPALSCTGMDLRISGSGVLSAYGGVGAEPLEASRLSVSADCRIFSTLASCPDFGEESGLAALAFTSPAEEDASLLWETGESRSLVLPQGYQSVMLSHDLEKPAVLRDSEGRKLCYLPAGESGAEGISLLTQAAEERLIDVSAADSLQIDSDGVYRLTGTGGTFHITMEKGVEAAVILDGVELGGPDGCFLTGLGDNRLTLICEEDSVLTFDSGFLEFLSGSSTARIEGPGVLRVEASPRISGCETELAGTLEIAAEGSDAVFTGPVYLGPEAYLKARAAGAGSVLFGPGASLTADGGRAELEVLGENAKGFEGLDLTLSADSAVSLRVSGDGAVGVELSGGTAKLAMESGASFTAFSENPTASCLTGEAQWDGGAALLCAELADGGLTAFADNREITVLCESRPDWRGSITLPERESGAYEEILMLLPGGGDYEFTCAADTREKDVMLTAWAEGIDPGLSGRELSFQALPRLTASMESGEFVYDGTAKSLELQGLPAGAEVSYENNGQTEPGIYRVTAIVRRPGFQTLTLAENLTIQKRLLTVTAQAEDKAVYDGTVTADGSILLGNALPGDDPQAAAVFVFDSPDVGEDKTVRVTDIALIEDENNWPAHYVLDRTEAVTQASVLSKAEVELALSHLSQEYGSVAGAEVSGAGDAEILVLYEGETDVPMVPGEYRVTAEIRDANISGSASGLFRVAKKKITLSGLAAPELEKNAEALEIPFENSRDFDAAVSGILPGDEVLVSGTAVYPDSTPGEKVVSFTGLTLTGAQADRYELSADTAEGRGTVRGGGQVIVPPGPDVPDEPIEPDMPDEPLEIPFTDIENHWAREDILAVAELGVMTGTGGKRFSPQLSMSRAMVMSVLFRLDGADPAEYPGSSYSDVREGSWYAPCVQWARENGIGYGMEDGAFCPDAPVTREQLAAFLYRFTLYRGQEAPTGQGLDFPDSAKVSFWAEEALSWAVGGGIVSGRTDGTLDPRGLATRAEAASMLRRYLDSRF